MTKRLFCAALLAASVFTAQADTLELVSKSLGTSPRPLGDSGDLIFSSDASIAAFTSMADNLVANDHNGFILDLFTKNLTTGEIKLITRGLDGSADGHSYHPTFSPDGKFLLFVSEAGNLVAEDDNELADLFRANLTDGTIERLSPAIAADSGAVGAASPEFSADGTKILFESDSSTIVPPDDNNSTDLFLLDLARGTTILLTRGTNSRTASGPGQAVGELNASFTPDGNGVVFQHNATNFSLPAITGTPYTQVYHYDLTSSRIRTVSATTSAQVGNNNSELRAVSHDGDYVAFITTASNLGTGTGEKLLVRRMSQSTLTQIIAPVATGVLNPGFHSVLYTPDDTKMVIQYGQYLYIYDIASRTYKSITGANIPNSALEPIALNPAGDTLFFQSSASLVPGSPNPSSTTQLYSYNLATEVIRLLSVDSQGTPSSEDVLFPVVSPNAQLAGFATFGLTPGPRQMELAVLNLATSTGFTPLLTASSSSLSANGFSTKASEALSEDGKKLLFSSFANDLVASDTDTQNDYFLYDVSAKSNQLIDVQFGPSTLGVNATPSLSSNGRYLIFVSTNSFPGIEDTNNVADVYRLEIATGQLQRVSVPRNTGGNEGASHSPRASADGEVIVFYTTSLRIGETNPGMAVRFMREGISRPIPRGPLGEPEMSNGFLLRSGEYFVSQRGAVFPLHKEDPITFTALGSGNASDAAIGNYLFVHNFSGSSYLADARTLETNRLPSLLTLAIAPDDSTLALRSLPLTSRDPAELLLYDVATRQTRAILPLSTNNIRDASLSTGGRRLLFSTSLALTPQDQNDTTDVYLYDSVSSSTLLISRTPAGRAGNHASASPDLSDDGTIIAFTSGASDLLGRDLNHATDVFIFKVESTDEDHDSLDDAWEITWFGNLSQAANDDFDNDGSSNIDEHNSGTNPTNGASALMVTRITNLKTGGISLLWQSTAGKRYQVQSKESLATPWQNLGAVYHATQSQTEAIDPAQPQPTRFYRILLVD